MAIRDDETAAKTLGIDVYKTKVKVFTITGVLAGMSGALLAFHNGVVSASLFTFDLQVKFVTMVMLGGVNSTWGALIGTFLIRLLPEVMRSFAKYMMLVYGICVVLLMIFMPEGIVGIFKKLFTPRRLKKGVADGGSSEG
jgi:branched-chain amino acid transport system permease protein